jgi:hypothetical protein
MPEVPSEKIKTDDDSGKFEIGLRLLGNEIIALSVSANPFTKRWTIYSLVTIGFLFVSIAAFGDAIVSFSSGIYETFNAQ